jgi:hypothetical protein
VTVDQYENSRDQGNPVNLYLFTYGAQPNAYFGYTDAEQPINYLGKDYKPIAIDRDALNASGSLDKATMKIRVARNEAISDLFRIYPPNQVVSLVMYQGHVSDFPQQYLVIWSGRVLSRDVQDNTSELTCEPIATSLRRSGLRRNYQYGCPHALYGNKCNANKTAARVQRNAFAQTAASISFSLNWFAPFQEVNFIGGLAEWVNFQSGEREIRTILKITAGTTLELSGIVRGLANGQTVDLFKGCARTMADCNLHNNINNFGGQPWIPTKNPIGTSNTF